MSNTLTAEEQLRNVANILLGYTQVVASRKADGKSRVSTSNGKGRSYTYVGNPDTVAQTGQQLAEMVLAFLRGELREVVVEDDGPPF